MPEKFSSDAPVLRTDASLLKDGPGTPVARGAPDTCPGFRPYEGQGQSFQDIPITKVNALSTHLNPGPTHRNLLS